MTAAEQSPVSEQESSTDMGPSPRAIRDFTTRGAAYKRAERGKTNQIPLRCPARYQVADQFATKFHYAIQLAISSRAGRKLDSVMEFRRELVCDLLASKIA